MKIKLNNGDVIFYASKLVTFSYAIVGGLIGSGEWNVVDEPNNAIVGGGLIISGIIFECMMRNSENEHNDKITIYGLGSSLNNDFNLEKIIFDENTYSIILTHEPDTINDLKLKFNNTNLILSGHSLNGSINLPIIKKLLLPNGSKNYYKPYYQLDNTNIYISNGIGVNNINFRLFNTPSFNLYRLNKI